MPIALITTDNPPAIVETHEDDQVNLRIGASVQVYNAAAGWQSPEGTYRLVAIVDTPVAKNRVATGESHLTVAKDRVIRTFTTVAAPPGPLTPVTSGGQ